MTEAFDYEKARHTPGFAEYERNVLGRINHEYTSGLAIASLVLGILWVGGAGSVMAIVFGGAALSMMRRDPKLRGRGLAVAGLVLGIIGTVLTVIMYVSVGAAVEETDRQLDQLEREIDTCAEFYETWDPETQPIPAQCT